MATSSNDSPESMRKILEHDYGLDLNGIPHENYDYVSVSGRCCENVIGYMPIPCGTAGPVLVNEKLRIIPMATTEGALVASVNRGCKAISLSGGVEVNILIHGMTRAPMFSFPSVSDAMELINWSTSHGFPILKESFESTTNHGKLLNLAPFLMGTDVVLRISANTSEAMGMNMVTKGVENICKTIQNHFPSATILSISSNMCVDKKSNMVNWILGRGRTLVGQAKIKRSFIETILKTTPEKLVDLNNKKCFKGSAMAGVIGGFNHHAANMVAAIFAATGQDLGQIVTSSTCMTEMVFDKATDALTLTCTLPSIELGTIGGGTNLGPQSAMIKIATTDIPLSNYPQYLPTHTSGMVYLDKTPPTPINTNVDKLAETLCAAVLAGELSLAAALTTNELVDAHMKYNRK